MKSNIDTLSRLVGTMETSMSVVSQLEESVETLRTLKKSLEIRQDNLKNEIFNDEFDYFAVVDVAGAYMGSNKLKETPSNVIMKLNKDKAKQGQLYCWELYNSYFPKNRSDAFKHLDTLPDHKIVSVGEVFSYIGNYAEKEKS